MALEYKINYLQSKILAYKIKMVNLRHKCFLIKF